MEQGLLHNEVENLYQEVLALLKRLIETQSFSKEEDQTAQMIGDFLEAKGVKYNREQNNIWAKIYTLMILNQQYYSIPITIR